MISGLLLEVRPGLVDQRLGLLRLSERCTDHAHLLVPRRIPRLVGERDGRRDVTEALVLALGPEGPERGVAGVADLLVPAAGGREALGDLGAAQGDGYRIGFGECAGKVTPALANPYERN